MPTRLVCLVLLTIMLVATGCQSVPNPAVLPEPTAMEAGSGSTPLPVSQPTASPAPDGTPVLQPSGSGASSELADADVDGAVQTFLDYWDAVNKHDYGVAQTYLDWQMDYQGPELFTSGLEDIVQVTALIGSPEPGAAGQHSITLPVTLVAVSNVPNSTTGGLFLEYFRGSYALQPRNPSPLTTGDWVITSAAISEALPGGAGLLSDVQDPATLVRSYFDAINHREFGCAFTYWDELGRLSGQSFAQFREGLATTGQVAVQLGEPSRNDVDGGRVVELPILVAITETDGTTETYCGSYMLKQSDKPPLEQFGWRIISAGKLRAVANVQLGSAEAETQLQSRCGAPGTD